MRYPLGNTLAVAVLIALIIAWFTSLILSLRDVPVQTGRGWFARILPVFTLLGIPAAIDLLQTGGLTSVFAVIVFIVFVLNILIPILRMTGRSGHPLVNQWEKWSIPISVIGGLAVAGYLTFIESTGTQVMCGPLGGCQEVQSSKYAILFGVLPVGLLGFVGYLAILAGWIVWQFGPQTAKKLAVLSIWGMCIFGVLFSIYLTFLEPFVIGATCMWCISSAVLMIILLLVSTPAAQQALSIEDDQESSSQLELSE
ncbi:MAG TPA: vitamin K epoxide reductase family protein [Anaerolineales bacterium]|nr:vitamin K epoxide reductase family protein [Anaerolineales bacterium]